MAAFHTLIIETIIQSQFYLKKNSLQVIELVYLYKYATYILAYLLHLHSNVCEY